MHLRRQIIEYINYVILLTVIVNGMAHSAKKNVKFVLHILAACSFFCTVSTPSAMEGVVLHSWLPGTYSKSRVLWESVVCVCVCDTVEFNIVQFLVSFCSSIPATVA